MKDHLRDLSKIAEADVSPEKRQDSEGAKARINAVLLALLEHPAGLSRQELAKKTWMSNKIIRNVLHKVFGRALVVKDDDRYVLTEKGQEAAAQVMRDTD